MRLVIQRVNHASVEMNETGTKNCINQGMVVLLAISKDFTYEKIDKAINKILKLRIWKSDIKGFDKNIEEIKGEILIISQFTLFGDCLRSSKPDFKRSAQYETAFSAYTKFIEKLKQSTSLVVKTGEFGAYMKVNLENDGPVTLILDI